MTKEKNLKIQIGNNIKAIREELKLTQEAFAVKIDSSGRMIREYEHNKFPVSSETIGLMIEVYRVNPVFLFTGIGNMFLDKEIKETYLEELKNKYQYDDKNLEKVIVELLNEPSLVENTLKLIELKRNDRDNVIETLANIRNFFD
ncbi:MAG: hypothetical protein A2039_05345 [Candidatus Melainabacteria bacterium GWA2_34_9]|nr:MAG: hypothetical protein A2039_05345 [Candidatus Melainabacteria bacterium GWA2_34_9]